MNNRRVMVVDDEANMRRVLEIMLSQRGYRTLAASDGREAFDLLQSTPIDLVISDLRMPVMNGIELLRELRSHGNDVPVIMITAHGSIEGAVEAMRNGAYDYLQRPFDVEALELAIGRVFAAQDLLQEKDFLRAQLDRRWQGLVGASPAMDKVRALAAQMGRSRASVLLTGETGTGKEVVARAIHRGSDRADRLFVPVNCAAIPGDILESELFGHERGAFTGASARRVGKFELASGGTIFLDEIAEMPLSLQSKLLRVLQENSLERLGGNQTIELDLRVISATNRRPRDAIREGRLREDLYFRLNVFSIEMSPLRERLDDLPPLVEHFIRAHSPTGRSPPDVSTAALEYLRRYDWPGNVRELGNMVERALILSGGRDLDLVHFPIDAEPSQPSAPAPASDLSDLRLEPAVEELECRIIAEALRRSGGSKSRAAQLLDISERSVWYKLKKYRLGDTG